MRDENETSARRAKLEQQLQFGTGWLAAIPAVTLLNVVLANLGSTVRVFVGLMSARVILTGMKGAGKELLGELIALLLVGLFWALWALARKGKAWAFIAALVFYSMDFALRLAIPRPFSVGFQLMAILFIFQALLALLRLRKMAPLEPAAPGANPEGAVLLEAG